LIATVLSSSRLHVTVNPFKLSRQHVKYVFGASIKTRLSEYKEGETTHRGIPSTLIELPPAPLQSGTDENGMYTEVVVPQDFEPGSIMVFRTQLEGVDTVKDAFYTAGADKAFSSLDLVDLNALLHRADTEERDATGGDGAYNIPGYGQLVYCGLEGWMAPLRAIIRQNDLGHALCGHLRAGCWAMDYIVERLERQLDVFPHLKAPAAWLRERFDRIKQDVAPFLRPKYFALVIYEAYKAGRRAVIEQCSEFISSGHSFTHDLALCSVQMYGMVKSASINPAKPVASLAAGLPHFSAGWARCWGRDVVSADYATAESE
jgi:glycogen debranching enzyme